MKSRISDMRDCVRFFSRKNQNHVFNVADFFNFFFFRSETGNGRRTTSGGSCSTTRHRASITITPPPNGPSGTGRPTATSSRWPSYRCGPFFLPPPLFVCVCQFRCDSVCFFLVSSSPVSNLSIPAEKCSTINAYTGVRVFPTWNNNS
jgi:hypothetical protein